MAWTHFTAPLAAGEELTAAMWYELCEALAERQIASQQAYQIDLTEAAAIAAAGVFPRGIPVRLNGGALGIMFWHVALSTVAIDPFSWANDTTTSSFLSRLGSSYITTAEWSAEGMTAAQGGTLATAVAEGWNDRRYWNVVRATIRRLQYPIIEATSSEGFQKNVTSSVNWADAVALYDVASEAAGTTNGAFLGTSLYLGVEWRIRNQRVESIYAAAATEAMESVEAWAFWGLNVYERTSPGDTVKWVIAGTADSVALVDTGSASPRFDLGTGLDLSAGFTLDLRLGSYDAVSPYEPLYPVPAGYDNSVERSALTYIYIAPAWTKP